MVLLELIRPARSRWCGIRWPKFGDQPQNLGEQHSRHGDLSHLEGDIARAHRWKRMIESGRFASLTELAAAEKINRSYLCRILRLTLLAPDIVETIVAGRQGAVQLAEVMGPLPVEWDRQERSMLR